MFEHTLALAQGNLEAPDLAECHGITCGLLCRLPDASQDALIRLLDKLELVKSPGSGLKTALEDLLNATRTQLADAETGFSLWLPSEKRIHLQGSVYNAIGYLERYINNDKEDLWLLSMIY